MFKKRPVLSLPTMVEKIKCEQKIRMKRPASNRVWALPSTRAWEYEKDIWTPAKILDYSYF